MKTEIRRFTTSHLLVLTTLTAVVFAIWRWLGPHLSFSLFLVAYAFAPTIALLVLSVLRDHSHRFRYGATAGVLAGFLAVMIFLCVKAYGMPSIGPLMIGTLIEWSGQAAVLVCLRLIIAGPTHHFLRPPQARSAGE